MDSRRSARPARVASRISVYGQIVDVPTAQPGLYVVATPIGNLGDVTLRALETLAGVDVIACEDTRVTAKLLDRYAITTPLTPYHDHNAATARPKLLARLAQGQSVALVSDAGTPLISDPGYRLTCEARDGGHPITAIPGPSATLAALSIAGLPTDRFYFEGFLPAKDTQRRARIEALARIDATIVLFESGRRLADTLDGLAAAWGAREAAVCRELTKLHEEVRRGPLPVLADDAASAEIRGEFVIVVAPPAADEPATADDLDDLLRRSLAAQSLKDAVAEVAAVTGVKRRIVYERALAIAKARHDPGD